MRLLALSLVVLASCGERAMVQDLTPAPTPTRVALETATFALG
jgi:hypothetical protein